MILAEKIVALRKQLGWSQEELAEKLSISRQSVSKWELGASIPDLDKILKLSEMFGVSTDYLLKEEEESFVYTGKEEQPEKRIVSAEEADLFMRKKKASAGKLASAMALFIFSPVCLFLFSGLSEAGRVRENEANGFGLMILLLLVAAGAGICIWWSVELKKFEYLKNEYFTLAYGVEGIVEKKKQAFQNTYRNGLVIGVSLCILAVVPVCIVSNLEKSELIMNVCVCLLLCLVAAGVAIMTRNGEIMESFNVLLRREDYTDEKKQERSRVGWFSGVYWSVVTVIFLAVLFLSETDRMFLIWVFAGVLYAPLYTMVKLLARNRK